MKSDFIHILNDFRYVHSPGPKADNPSGTNFWCQQKALITLPICCRFKKKKIALKSNLYTFFFCFTICIEPRAGADNPLGTKFWWQQKGLFSLPKCCKFQNDQKSDFIHIFNDFIHVYSPRARAENPLGTNFWCQQKALITSTICCKFQTNLSEFWFYTHF